MNTRAVALLMAEFARRHIARGATRGRIVNVSTAGAYCFPSEVSYGAIRCTPTRLIPTGLSTVIPLMSDPPRL